MNTNHYYNAFDFPHIAENVEPKQDIFHNFLKVFLGWLKIYLQEM